MDNGLVQAMLDLKDKDALSLNPYCSGQWSRTTLIGSDMTLAECLNPYCSGQWSRTDLTRHY